MSQQRHKVHANRQQRYKNPDEELLSQERHKEHANHQQRYRNPDDIALSRQRMIRMPLEIVIGNKT